MRVFSLEVVGETKRHDRQASVVVCTRLFRGAVLYRLRALVGVIAFFAVDVADTDIPSGFLKGFAQEARVAHAVLHDVSKAAEAKMDEIVVLTDDLGTRT